MNNISKLPLTKEDTVPLLKVEQVEVVRLLKVV